MCPRPRARMPARKARTSRKGTERLSARRRSNCSGDVSATGAIRKAPALFTSKSGAPPNSRSAARTTDSMPSGAARSTRSSMVPGWASASPVRETARTRAPAAPSAPTTARPIPRDPPVTTAVRLANGETARPGEASLARPAPELSAAGPGSIRETEKFIARLGVRAERASYRAGDRFRVLLLDAAHHHAQVLRFDDHADAMG